MGWYHYNTSPKAKKGMFPKVLVDDLNKIPIPPLTEDFISTSISLVNSILNSKKQDIKNDTSFFENQIDQLVYQLYGLTEDEILTIEQN